MENETIQTNGALSEAPVQITTRWENLSAFVEETFVPAPPESKTDSWTTPQEEFDKFNRDFNFNLDVCASHENYKCKPYFTIEDNGLKQLAICASCLISLNSRSGHGGYRGSTGFHLY
jgi:hypothetical protein